MRASPPLWSLAVVAVVLAVPGAARADVVEYVGPHPLSPELGRGLCFVEGPHLHAYEPQEVEVLYVEDDGAYVFVGDPTPYEPVEAPRHAYYGHHPVHWSRKHRKKGHKHEDDHYCYISGPHHHWYSPAAGPDYEERGGVHWYVGVHPGWYHERAAAHVHVDAYWGGVLVTRPVVTIAPPIGFVGFFVLGAWRPEGTVWYHKGKHGPPPWAPAWGRRNHLVGPGGGLKVKGGPGGVVHFKAKGGPVKFKAKGGPGGGKLMFKGGGGKGGGHFKGGGGKGHGGKR